MGTVELRVREVWVLFEWNQNERVSCLLHNKIWSDLTWLSTWKFPIVKCCKEEYNDQSWQF